jgi:uncharacterized protein with von Willebrand factor type A (vWA) domain
VERNDQENDRLFTAAIQHEVTPAEAAEKAARFSASLDSILLALVADAGDSLTIDEVAREAGNLVWFDDRRVRQLLTSLAERGFVTLGSDGRVAITDEGIDLVQVAKASDETSG